MSLRSATAMLALPLLSVATAHAACPPSGASLEPPLCDAERADEADLDLQGEASAEIVPGPAVEAGEAHPRLVEAPDTVALPPDPTDAAADASLALLCDRAEENGWTSTIHGSYSLQLRLFCLER